MAILSTMQQALVGFAKWKRKRRLACFSVETSEGAEQQRKGDRAQDGPHGVQPIPAC